VFDGWDLVSETSPSTPTFQIVAVAGRRFALDSAAVVSAIDPVAPTHVPGTPAWVRGVIMWEGQVVPVLGTAERLGLGAVAARQLLELKVGGEPFFLEIEALGDEVSALDFERSDQRMIIGFVQVAGESVPILDLNLLTDISDEAAG
jgi:chemotaxis signal transduction protein